MAAFDCPVAGLRATVLVETNAGGRAGFSDELCTACGAGILDHGAQVFEQAELIVKVKEPQRNEVAQLRPGQIRFAYLHLATDPDLTHALVQSTGTSPAAQ